MKKLCFVIILLLVSQVIFSADEPDLIGVWKLIKSEPAKPLPEDRAMTTEEIFQVLTLKKEESTIRFEEDFLWSEFELGKKIDGGAYLLKDNQLYFGSKETGGAVYKFRQIDEETIELTGAKGKYTYKLISRDTSDAAPNPKEAQYRKDIIGEWKLVEKISNGIKYKRAPGAKSETIKFSTENFYINENSLLTSTLISEYEIQGDILLMENIMSIPRMKIISLDDSQMVLEARTGEQFVYNRLNRYDINSYYRMGAEARSFMKMNTEHTVSQIFRMTLPLDLYYDEHKHYPEGDIDTLPTVLNKDFSIRDLTDSWGEKLIYKAVNSGNSYYLISKGQDKKVNFDFKDYKTIGDDIVMMDNCFKSEHAVFDGIDSWVEATEDPKYLTCRRINDIRFRIIIHNSKYQKYPEGEVEDLMQELGHLAQKGKYIDGWGNIFHYKSNGQEYTLISTGPDGKPDTDSGNNDDLNLDQCEKIGLDALVQPRKHND